MRKKLLLALSVVAIGSLSFADDIRAFKDGFEAGYEYALKTFAKDYPEKMKRLLSEIKLFNELKMNGLIEGKVIARYSQLPQAGMSEEELKVLIAPVDLKKVKQFEYLYEELKKEAQNKPLPSGYYIALPESAPRWVKGLLYFAVKRLSPFNSFFYAGDEFFYAGKFQSPASANALLKQLEQTFPEVFSRYQPTVIRR
jgi:hypothetical protein